MTKTRLRVADADCLILSQYSTSSLRHVSEPSEYSVPGTLLEMVAGRRVIGMHSDGYWSLALRNCETAWKASKPPMRKRASNLYCSIKLAMFSMFDSLG